ncbi:Dyp-type peroxidase [Flammeovirga kamogawensis]|uniref:Dyp-type peroxidase n=1 Tax=Flammeovirga kamogawensis TaxID=373891 RepID=A0ABX8H0V3_9BACT|nr:Dyp-type peroxidase [Flammeovirga kamogawensis]MBB6463640.1 putative iron-dependent peroxidase [Flammeovirga kamogawensis]QWG09254.1 Dyp-type peroxidase [Flammeovirga kamogawensis]TRX64779.1 Dyp-type peroxidase [Flammeovirga kamogawensis]
MNLVSKTQEGLLSDPTPFVEYLTLELKQDKYKVETILAVFDNFSKISKSIGQKDTTALLTITIGFSSKGWTSLFPNEPMPNELHPFIELKSGDRHFPSTPGDIFFMVKSMRMDLNYQATKYILSTFKPIANAIQDIQGYKYLDDRDLIDFVDGTENPKSNERAKAVIIDHEPYVGGSYLIVQQYFDKQEEWDSLTTEYQEGVIGRTKMDDIEIEDDKKKPYAHNVKSKVEIDGVEIKMLRQNRPFGNAMEHGTMFIGFAKSASIIETSLKQMIEPGENGHHDKLLDYVTAKTGTLYFIPPQSFLDNMSN